jgi:hypothetical protein
MRRARARSATHATSPSHSGRYAEPDGLEPTAWHEQPESLALSEHRMTGTSMLAFAPEGLMVTLPADASDEARHQISSQRDAPYVLQSLWNPPEARFSSHTDVFDVKS